MTLYPWNMAAPLSWTSCVVQYSVGLYSCGYLSHATMLLNQQLVLLKEHQCRKDAMGYFAAGHHKSLSGELLMSQTLTSVYRFLNCTTDYHPVSMLSILPWSIQQYGSNRLGRSPWTKSQEHNKEPCCFPCHLNPPPHKNTIITIITLITFIRLYLYLLAQ